MVPFIRNSNFVQNVVYFSCVQRMAILIFESELIVHRFLDIPAFESEAYVLNDWKKGNNVVV